MFLLNHSAKYPPVLSTQFEAIGGTVAHFGSVTTTFPVQDSGKSHLHGRRRVVVPCAGDSQPLIGGSHPARNMWILHSTQGCQGGGGGTGV